METRPGTNRVNSCNSRTLAHLAAGSFVFGCVLLRLFPPDLYSFYPKCPIFEYFHVYCPGCGATRALAALLRGQFAIALHYNAFFVILLPMLLAYFGLAYSKLLRGSATPWPAISARALQIACGAALLFAVVRNAVHFTL